MKAAFIDRDGTVIENTAYINRVGQMGTRPFVDGALEGMKRLQMAGFELVIVTNQGGVGAGFLKEDTLRRIHAVLDLRLAREGVYLGNIFVCKHHPDSGCGCRKPKPGLLHIASREMDIDLAQSIMIGDMESDKTAGKAAGCKASLVLPAYKIASTGETVTEYRSWRGLDLTKYCG